MIKGATYDSTPCKNCGGVARYVANHNCPQCQAEANKRYKARKAAAEGKSYTPRELVPYNPNKRGSLRENSLKTMLKILLAVLAGDAAQTKQA